MELELTLSPPNQKTPPIINKSFHGGHNPRSTVTRFPLQLSWNQAKDDDDDDDDEHSNRFFNCDHQQEMDCDGEGLIGWPPLHSWRKRFMEESHFEEGEGFNGRVDEEGGNINGMLFVKVKMDGVGIARKIDLNAFHSYHMLTTTLIHMFDKYVENDEDGASYKLMYQHKDGHWLLAGDLPWEMFVQAVQRLQMVRN